MATKSVYCYELRKYFPSITDAARESGANASSISACCKGKQERAGGYRWTYFEVNGHSIANIVCCIKPLTIIFEVSYSPLSPY